MSDNPDSYPNQRYMDSPNNYISQDPSAQVNDDAEEGQVFQSFFGPPVNGSKEDTQKLILKEGFTGMYNLQKFDNHCFVRFRTKAEFDAFNKHFDGFIYNDGTKDVKMFATESKKRLVEYPPCTRLVISGFGRKRPTERELYNLFYPYGFIKHITLKQRHAFVDFDTIEDAKRVLEEMQKEESNFHMSINYCSEAPNTEWTDTVMPLTDLLPNDHPFWQQIISLIQGNRPKPY